MQTKNIFKTDCSKRGFLSDKIGGLFKNTNDEAARKHAYAALQNHLDRRN